MLVPVKWGDLSKRQQKRLVRSHMFLYEKFIDGILEKLKARLVANGSMQDRSIYDNFSLPPAKMK